MGKGKRLRLMKKGLKKGFAEEFSSRLSENFQRELKKSELWDQMVTEFGEKKALELQNKRTEAKRFIEDTQREMQMMSQQEMVKLQEEIRPIIMRVGKEKGLTVILEITAVAYYDPAADITNDIIKIMDGQ